MRVASNKLKHIIDFFYSELDKMYPSPEIEALVNTSVHSFLGYSKTDILLKKEDNVNQSDLLKLYDTCKALKKNVPLQYILGESFFYNLKFHVNQNVLIPRPETEELVELILNENTSSRSILDIGTGSGCIPISLKKNRDSWNIFACDISDEALGLAKKNAELNKTEVHFFEADVLQNGAIQNKTEQKFDIIVSNPPYIKSSEKNLMEKNVFDHEPHLALFVEGNDAIVFYKKIIDLCTTLLSEKGTLYFELNPFTAELVKEYAFQSHSFNKIELLKDMSGKTRFFKGLKN